MIILLTVLAIIPWSLIIGLAYLAYRRVRAQRVREEAEAVSFEPQDFENAASLQSVPDIEDTRIRSVDADHIAPIGRA